jgi:phospholipid/cholesterol/gamma-HCH transport system permease protein
LWVFRYSVHPMNTHPTIRLTVQQDQKIYLVDGLWTVDHATECLDASQKINPPKQAKIVILCRDLKQFDVTGLWIFYRRIDEIRRAGTTVELQGFRQDYIDFLDGVLKASAPPPKDLIRLRHLPGEMWKLWKTPIRQGLDILDFLGKCWVLLFGILWRPTHFRFRAFIKQCEVAAVRAAPIVALISFLIAIVISYQGSYQLKRFGAEIYTVNLVAVSVLREMAVLLTAIVIAGRSGSAFAAEIGAMKLNEETDALTTTGIDPLQILVLPRVAALTVMMPLLAFLADVMGLLGGGLLTTATTNMNWQLFISRLSDAIRVNDFWIGIWKAPVFGFVIAVVGCYHGFRVTNSAESVGRETTAAVVHSIFLVILIDAVFSLILTALDL